MSDFSQFALSAPLTKAVTQAGYDQPTPIQEQAIPVLLQGRDLLGIAQTGTGKTAAFALPTLDHLHRTKIDTPRSGCRALVLAPTRELAAQIADSFKTYARFLPALSVDAVFGGVPVGKQIRRLRFGVDVLVATPGRLLDLCDQRALSLNDVEVLILDEADQMMDLGFIHPLRRIVKMVPKERQTLFFSATMPKAIAELASEFLKDPAKVSVAPQSTTAERVEQSVCFLSKRAKPAMLAHLLSTLPVERALVFTRTKHGADRVVKQLDAQGHPAVAIHGNKSQGQRQRALASFKSGETPVLVATDIAARGIDVSGVSHVINYELPHVPEQYVHRIGRTARAGAEGAAVALVANDERGLLKDIERATRQRLPNIPLPAELRDVGEPELAEEPADVRTARPPRRPRPPAAPGARSEERGAASTNQDGKKPHRKGQNRRKPAPSGRRPRRDGARAPTAAGAPGGPA